jgi:hypothetical protein
MSQREHVGIKQPVCLPWIHVCSQEASSLWEMSITPSVVVCRVLCTPSDLVEGKYHPPERPASEYDDKGGKTIGLLVRLKEKLWGSAKVVVLDRGFCVLKGLIELLKKGASKREDIGQSISKVKTSRNTSRAWKLVRQIVLEERWMMYPLK